MKQSTKLLGVIATTLLAAMALTGCAAHSSPVSEAEAVEFVEDAIRQAESLSHAEYCERFGSRNGFCQSEDGLDMDRAHDAHLVCTKQLASGSYAARVASQGAGGREVISDLEVLREDSQLVAVNPVWWVERVIVDATEDAMSAHTAVLDDCG